MATSQLTYAEATAELDAIIAEFDHGQVDVDRLGDRFQRATELVEELDRRIRATRSHVESLSPRLDAVAAAAEGAPAPAVSAGPGNADDDEDEPF
jgi:exodeoxyribonuclease VII small subunit